MTCDDDDVEEEEATQVLYLYVYGGPSTLRV